MLENEGNMVLLQLLQRLQSDIKPLFVRNSADTDYMQTVWSLWGGIRWRKSLYIDAVENGHQIFS